MKRERAKQLLQDWWKPILLGFASGVAKDVILLLLSHYLK
jgi:hypothetical protein